MEKIATPKCWIISEYYYPVLVTTGYYVTEIAEYMSKKGLNVAVITTNNKYYKNDISSKDEYEIRNGVEIFRTLKSSVDKDNNIKRSWRLFSSSLSLFLLAIKRIKRRDFVIVLTNPAFLMLFMPLVRFVTKCQYHILVHDIFPENLVSLGKVPNESFLYRLLKQIFDSAYSKANSCISIGYDMTKVLEGKLKGEKEITQITNWADVGEVKPSDKRDTYTFERLRYKISDSIIFEFAGNLGKAQGLDNLMEAISTVQNNKAKFLFIGAGAKLKDIEAFSSLHDNTISIGFLDRSEQNDFLNACDVGIVTLADGMFGLGVPSKSYNIMATGKPILYIGELDSEIAICIKKYDIGWIVKPNSPKELSKKIEEITNNPEDIKAKGLKAFQVASQVFAKSVILDKYYMFVKSKI